MEDNSFDKINKIFKILIVDDDKDILDALRITLSNAWEFNSEISTTTNFDTALAELAKNNYDLILVDYNISGMNGIELLNKIHENNPETSRILITDFSDLEEAKVAIDSLDVDYYIEKPLYFEELLTKIHTTLMKRTKFENWPPVKVSNCDEGLKIIKKVQRHSNHKFHAQNQLQTFTLEFNSQPDFKLFIQKIKIMENVFIDDFETYEERYLITLGLFINGIDKII